MKNSRHKEWMKVNDEELSNLGFTLVTTQCQFLPRMSEDRLARLKINNPVIYGKLMRYYELNKEEEEMKDLDKQDQLLDNS